MTVYTTVSGDEWDIIAKKVYGDEMYMDLLLDANPDYIGLFRFGAGIVLACPEKPTNKQSVDIPEWRK